MNGQPHIMNNADDRNAMGFPLIPFALLWPIIRMVAVPLLRAILPWFLERVAESIRTGQALQLTDQELDQAVAMHESTVQTAYKAG